MSKFQAIATDAVNQVMDFFFDTCNTCGSYSELRCRSLHLNVKGIDTLYIRVFPTSFPPRLVISSISLPVAHRGKRILAHIHASIMEHADARSFLLEYENVMTARLLNFLANRPSFLSGHLREYERVQLARDTVAKMADAEKADPECSMLPFDANVTCVPNFYTWLIYVTARAANAPRTPINPLHYDYDTVHQSYESRWQYDLPCAVQVLEAGAGVRALVLDVQGAPDNIDLTELNWIMHRIPFHYTEHSVGIDKLHINVHEKSTGVVHKVYLRLTYK